MHATTVGVELDMLLHESVHNQRYRRPGDYGSWLIADARVELLRDDIQFLTKSEDGTRRINDPGLANVLLVVLNNSFA